MENNCPIILSKSATESVSPSSPVRILKYLLYDIYTEWVIMWIITVMIMVMMANLEIRSEIGSRSTLEFFSSLVFFIVGLHKHTDTFRAVTVRLTIQPPEAMTTLNTPN
jgi:hypothetical protein